MHTLVLGAASELAAEELRPVVDSALRWKDFIHIPWP
jgi:hypothetical protein